MRLALTSAAARPQPRLEAWLRWMMASQAAAGGGYQWRGRDAGDGKVRIA
jgi:hypothetical protein